VLADDMMRLYAGEALEPARPYRDFLAWQARQDGAARAEAWLGELQGVRGPTLVLPGASRGQAADMREVVLPVEPGELAPGAGLDVTPGTLVQGAWAIVLAALTGHQDVVFGVTVSGRPGELAGVESMVGLFINTIPVRAVVDQDGTAGEFLTGLQRRQASLLEHQHHGLTEIHQALGVSTLFDTLVVFQSVPASGRRGTELAVTGIDSLGRGSYPLTLIVETGRLTVQYDRNAISQPAVDDIAARFVSVARQLARGGDRRIGTLEDLPRAMVRAAAEPAAVPAATGSREARTPREKALCELFAEVLEVERVGIDDDLFALGCNSLTATRIIGRMRRTLGLETSIATIFRYPTIAELSGRVTAAKSRPGPRPLTARVPAR
jgi:hypothetical protein